MAIIGYGMLIAVPLLALADHWQLAAVFVFLERTGKALRSPAKDVMLSHATKQVGTGMGFGIHEAIDQIGGIIGPLLFTVALAINNDYKMGYTLMWIPALLTVAVLLTARWKVPEPALLEDCAETQKDKPSGMSKLPRMFWVYSLFIFFSVLGFANFTLISFHLIYRGIVAQGFIPILYAIAMAVDAVVALIAGKLYDRVGLGFLIILPILTLPIVFLGFSFHYEYVLVGVVLWGAVMAMHESIMRAGIADLIPKDGRGRAYGVFNTIYGISWLIGSALMGYLYESSISSIFVFVLVAEIIAMVVFLRFKRDLQGAARGVLR
ncbi:MFS transporter [Desulfosporosinus burensis]